MRTTCENHGPQYPVWATKHKSKKPSQTKTPKQNKRKITAQHLKKNLETLLKSEKKMPSKTISTKIRAESSFSYNTSFRRGEKKKLRYILLTEEIVGFGFFNSRK